MQKFSGTIHLAPKVGAKLLMHEAQLSNRSRPCVRRFAANPRLIVNLVAIVGCLAINFEVNWLQEVSLICV